METRIDDHTDMSRQIAVYVKDGKFARAYVTDGKIRIFDYYISKQEVIDRGNDVDRIKRIIANEKL